MMGVGSREVKGSTVFNCAYYEYYACCVLRPRELLVLPIWLEFHQVALSYHYPIIPIAEFARVVEGTRGTSIIMSYN